MAKFITKPTGGKRRKKRRPSTIVDWASLPPVLPGPCVMQPKPAIKLRADPIITRLPQMAPDETLGIWVNALRILNENGMDGEARQQAERVATAVEDV